jgi:hypothetical protein
MPIHKTAARLPATPQLSFAQPAVLSLVSMSALALTPIAVLAVVLGAWRLGADPGWTSRFFIADGLLSRYQLWFVIAIAARVSALMLHRWAANRDTAVAGSKEIVLWP